MPPPSGNITFLFTDIEGSTKLWELSPDAMRVALARHDALLRDAIEQHDGFVFKTVGDSFCAAFSTAPDAVNAALDAQLALSAHGWEETGPIRVRMRLHTGLAEMRDNDYFGPTLNRVARLQSVGYGQQTLLSHATYGLLSGALPTDASLFDLGMHRLKDLAAPEHVWQLTHPSLPQGFPPLKSLDYLPTNLPAQITSFIGREQQMEEIKKWLQTARIVTLTGSGGCGKTRLSLQVAADLLDIYRDGVWLVEFASLADDALVPQSVADTLLIRAAPGEPVTSAVLSFLKDKQILLVLDNCEHVLDASARLVDTIVKSCPEVSVLATSRESLGIGGENAYRVPSLTVPDINDAHTPLSLSEYESVRLFVSRAGLAKPDFAVTPKNAARIAAVCHRLDGIPFAIELAAARVRSLTIEQVASHLDNLFRLVTGGSRAALPRQQTLRAMIDWSYNLLDEKQKLLFCQLSVFSGGWTLEAAERVCAGAELEDWDILNLLTSLVDKSLVVAEERGEAVRYRILEMVRHYGRDRLIEREALLTCRARHLACYADLAKEAARHNEGPEQAGWLRRLEIEHDNLRAALDFCCDSVNESADPAHTSIGQLSTIESYSDIGLNLVCALCSFWMTYGHVSEGRRRVAAFLMLTPDRKASSLLARALHWGGNLAYIQSDLIEARSYYERVSAIYRELGDRAGEAGSLGNLATIMHTIGDYTGAREQFERTLAILEEDGYRRDIGVALVCLGNVMRDIGDEPAARNLLDRAVKLQREMDDRLALANALNNFGLLEDKAGNTSDARSAFEEALHISLEMGSLREAALIRLNLSSIACREGDLETTRSLLAAAIVDLVKVGAVRDITTWIESSANLEAARKEFTRSATLLGALHKKQLEQDTLPTPEVWEKTTIRLRGDLSDEAFGSAYTRGNDLTLEQIIEYATQPDRV